jgi:hypothetical protein
MKEEVCLQRDLLGSKLRYLVSCRIHLSIQKTTDQSSRFLVMTQAVKAQILMKNKHFFP